MALLLRFASSGKFPSFEDEDSKLVSSLLLLNVLQQECSLFLLILLYFLFLLIPYKVPSQEVHRSV